MREMWRRRWDSSVSLLCAALVPMTTARTGERLTDVTPQTGQNAHPATLTTFFPPGSSPGMSLPTYISALSAPLAALSPPAELAAAFSAFDADDSGQIDVAELRNALLVTGDGGMSPREVDAVLAEFTGRRAFAKGQTGPRGDVFRWRDFVGATSGAGAGTAPVEAEGRAA